MKMLNEKTGLVELTKDEIAQLADPSKVMLSGGAILSSGKIRTWPATKADTLIDASGSGNHGTVVDPEIFVIDRTHPLAVGLVRCSLNH